MIRPILRYGEASLTTKAAPVERFDDGLRTLLRDMAETMYAAPGVGLAAPQIGVPLRVFVIDISVGKRGGELIEMINPEFIVCEGMQLEEEGCLSIPGFEATVVRPMRAVVRGFVATAPTKPSKGRACLRAHCSTRWITWTARCSWIACAASSAT